MNIGFARGFISIAHRGMRGDKAGQLQSQGRAGRVLTLVLAAGNPDGLTEELSPKDGLKVDGALSERRFPNRLRVRGWFGGRLAA